MSDVSLPVFRVVARFKSGEEQSALVEIGTQVAYERAHPGSTYWQAAGSGRVSDAVWLAWHAFGHEGDVDAFAESLSGAGVVVAATEVPTRPVRRAGKSSK